MTGVVGGDAKVGDTVTICSVAARPSLAWCWPIRLSLSMSQVPTGRADSDKTVEASITSTDAAGNSASSTDTESGILVAGVPSVSVNIVDASLNQADTTSSVTFTFSEAPVGFDASDITVANGSLSGLTATANPLVWSATFTATAGFEGTGSVSVNPSSYVNAAGNPGSGSTDTVAIDTKPPAPTITLDANITSDDIINIAETSLSMPVTRVVGATKVGDTVTLTVNGKTFTGLVLADKTFSINDRGPTWGQQRQDCRGFPSPPPTPQETPPAPPTPSPNPSPASLRSSVNTVDGEPKPRPTPSSVCPRLASSEAPGPFRCLRYHRWPICLSGPSYPPPPIPCLERHFHGDCGL